MKVVLWIERLMGVILIGLGELFVWVFPQRVWEHVVSQNLLYDAIITAIVGGLLTIVVIVVVSVIGFKYITVKKEEIERDMRLSD